MLTEQLLTLERPFFAQISYCYIIIILRNEVQHPPKPALTKTKDQLWILVSDLFTWKAFILLLVGIPPRYNSQCQDQSSRR